MQQPNYPPRGYAGHGPPQQQHPAPRSAGGGHAPHPAGFGGTMPINPQQLPPSQSAGTFSGPRSFSGVQQPLAPRSDIGQRPNGLSNKLELYHPKDLKHPFAQGNTLV
uniref:Uncharacterized protein n=1 Tax=Hyaloperonospora arabidopsidis (strain Emoy2) TaxID=559515 RepID=M4C4M6_HYAAE